MNGLVELHGVTKRFSRLAGHDSLRDWLIASARRWFNRVPADAHPDVFTALDRVSLAVPPGEAIGVIGPNGAGKSTILRLLAGILRPDAGVVSVQGRLAALIEVGAGFHGDLTGRENIYLNGTILGMTRVEIRERLDDIVAFAGLRRFLDMPVKRYSSGMYARLGFSIAAHVDPDVLLVDEVLSVGDAVFRLRCLDRMRRLVAGGTTLVFVTHDLDQMQAICRRAIVLERGRVAFDGPAADAVGHYMRAMSGACIARPTDVLDADDASRIEDLDVRLTDQHETETSAVKPGEPLHIQLRFRARQPIERLVCELNLRSITGRQLISVNSGRDQAFFRVGKGACVIDLHIATVPLAPGQYFWNVRMWDADSGVTLVDTPFRYPMAVEHAAVATGALCLPHKWMIGACADAASVGRKGVIDSERRAVTAGETS